MRQRFAQWLLRGVHLTGVLFGDHSIAISPVAVGDIIRWAPAAGPTPVAAGDFGMTVEGPNTFVTSQAAAATLAAYGGQSLGALATLGTNDAQDFAFKSGGVERARFLGSGTTAGVLGVATSTPNTQAQLQLAGPSGGAGPAQTSAYTVGSARALLAPRYASDAAFTSVLNVNDTGLLYYNTTSNQFRYWNGVAWVPVGSSVGTNWLVSGNTGVANPGIFGTNAGDNAGISVVTDGVELLRFTSGGGGVTAGFVGYNNAAPVASVQVTQQNVVGGTPTAFRVDGGTNTSVPNTETIDINFNIGGPRVTFVGAPADVVIPLQRAVFIGAPSYGRAVIGNSADIGDGATLAIDGAPGTGVAVVIENPSAILCGNVGTFAGNIVPRADQTGVGVLQGSIGTDPALGAGPNAVVALRRWFLMRAVNGVFNNITSPLFTPGSVIFAGAGGTLSQNNPLFFWDNTNHRLGIGTAAPTATLHDRQPAATSGSPIALLVQGGAHTTLANASLTDIDFDMSVSPAQFTGGGAAIPIADAMIVFARTYTAVAAQTISRAVTLEVGPAPTAGANITITNRYALLVAAGGNGLAAFGDNIISIIDNTSAVGTASQRWASVNTGPTGHLVFNAAGDANPSAQLNESGGNGQVLLGPGGATPPDVSLQRAASFSTLGGGGAFPAVYHELIASSTVVGDSIALLPSSVGGTTLGAIGSDPAVAALGAGAPLIKWALGRFSVVITGDMVMLDTEGNAQWCLKESGDCIWAKNNRTGKVYELVMKEIKHPPGVEFARGTHK
jgi:hypothetical protein